MKKAAAWAPPGIGPGAQAGLIGLEELGLVRSDLHKRGDRSSDWSECELKDLHFESCHVKPRHRNWATIKQRRDTLLFK